MRIATVLLILTMVATGCTTRSRARAEADRAFLAGHQAGKLAEQSIGVTVIGAVERSQVPWVAGLTLAQAIATANYLDPDDPKEIIITRRGETARMKAGVLLRGVAVPLEPGDVVEIR